MTRDDSGWRNEVMEARGERCRRCGSPHGVQADHVISRSHSGPSVLANGTPLCRGCHDLKTDNKILYEPSWLDSDQIEWLAREGFAIWDEQGQVSGMHSASFADRRPGWWWPPKIKGVV